MADKEQLAILKSGVEKWKSWRDENPDADIKLGGANLGGASLSQADLRGVSLNGAYMSAADLSGADLRRANLSGANLSRADLSGADLRGADVIRAYLSDADLSYADLSDADLNEANLSHADLRGTDLSNARVGETVFGNVDLREALGLDSCKHSSPSTLDYRTLLKSGQLPQPFLRGCGLSDNFIEYLPSLLAEGGPIQFYSCFISYSTKDQGFAERLHADLQNKGVRCWFAPHDIQGGKKIHEQIDQAIRLYDRLLLILSAGSMSSEWVSTEIAKARKRELSEKRRMLFPVRLVDFDTLRGWECFDADTGKDSAREIREYFVPDFSNWKDHDSYMKGLERLLRDLQQDKRF